MEAIWIDEPLSGTAQASRYVELITGRWRNAPPVQVVPSPADLPVPAPGDARGLYTGRDVWIVAQNVDGAVARALTHEAIGHHAMRESLGPAWRELMHSVWDGAEGRCGHLQDLRREVADVYGEMPPSAVADEMAAGVVERLTNPRTCRLEATWPLAKRVSAAWGLARREVLLMDTPASYSELEGHLLFAEDHLRHGRRWLGLGWLLGRWHTDWMKPTGSSTPPRDLEESARWLREADFNAHRWDWIRELPTTLFALGCALACLVVVCLWIYGFAGLFGSLSRLLAAF